MAFELPALPYAPNALEPHISAETLGFHHGKHHAAYVNSLNAAVAANPDLQGKTLVQIVRSTQGPAFNAAAQSWNHDFYWKSMSPTGGGAPTGPIADAINASFGSFEAFKEKFTAAAIGQFASGWAWLVKSEDGSLSIHTTGNAETPLTHPGKTPLLTCDVWEHAYYVDYRNARANYVAAWWSLVNWDFANENLAR
jgi:Fe-Mn family superoxide dismutase